MSNFVFPNLSWYVFLNVVEGVECRLTASGQLTFAKNPQRHLNSGQQNRMLGGTGKDIGGVTVMT